MNQPIVTQLKYLFEVHYLDGTTYRQNEEDKSIFHNEGSSFTDVDRETKPIHSFCLFNNEHVYAVNLIDGHFEVDGVQFYMHKEEHLKKFRLVYFRGHNVSQTFSVTIGDNEEKVFTPTGKTVDLVTYNFGWQCTIGGKNYKEIMQIQ